MSKFRNEMERKIQLFIENLFEGKATIDESKDMNIDIDEVYSKIKRLKIYWELREEIDADSPEVDTYIDSLHYLYDFIIKGRLRGSIIGVWSDKTSLEKIDYLTNENSKLHKENVMLATELEDRKNIISSYENGSYDQK